MGQRAVFCAARAAIFALLLLVIGCGGRASDPLAADEGGTVANKDAGVEVRVDASTDRTIDSNVGTNVDATVDAPAIAADAMRCSATTCPAGCCDANGQCQSGDSSAACGRSGLACQDCVAKGLASCDASSRACFTKMGQCDASSCKGCCVQNVCFAGTDPSDCGSGGQACQSCSAAGLTCSGQQCIKPTCGPTTCAGCCIGTQCLAGKDPTACGQQGVQCNDCAAVGAACIAAAGAGGACGPGKCNASTCSTGCCDVNGICQTSGTSAACGLGGSACQTCPAGTQCVGNRACACTALSCPTGCCSGLRPPGRGGVPAMCLPGAADSQCGSGGAFCQNCLAGGGACSNQNCAFPPPCVGCPNGCCDKSGQCQPGATNVNCGSGGSYCQDCTQSATVCSSQQCGAQVDAGVCNAQTCPSGCCDSQGVCQQGLTSTVCGNFGTNCQNCLGASQLCTDQQCQAPVDAGTACALNCNGCCDALGNCQGGNVDTQCGGSGSLCIDCAKLGDSCVFNACTAPDGGTLCSQTCSGCCDVNGSCQPGFANAQCGGAGSTCEDCTTLKPPSTCDLNISTRTCTSQQTQCPAPYPSCPTRLQELQPTPQRVCSTSELQSAAGACSGGAVTAACIAFLSYESSSNVACANCLQAFDFDFVAQAGVRSCVAPYVDAICNHNSACIVDCTTQGCYSCPDSASTAQCDTQVQSGACLTYSLADQCVAQALSGPAGVCNPTTYQGNFGAWFQAVGAKYCGQ